jgi:hypothetical protein
VKLDHKVQQVLKVQKVTREIKATLVAKDQRVRPVSAAHREMQVQQEPTELMELA